MTSVDFSFEPCSGVDDGREWAESTACCQTLGKFQLAAPMLAAQAMQFSPPGQPEGQGGRRGGRARAGMGAENAEI